MLFNLTKEEGNFLIKIARKAVEVKLNDGKTIAVPKNISSKLKQQQGVFVTINSLGDGTRKLRGCIGFPYPTHPLVNAVIEAAIESAIRDPRFTPIIQQDLKRIVFEISVLSQPELIKTNSPLDYPSKIIIGKDGLIIDNGSNKGLLLPQVPLKWKWDAEEFLCQCCMKSGLSPDCWILKGVRIYKFSSIIIKEETPNGRITMVDLCKPKG